MDQIQKTQKACLFILKLRKTGVTSTIKCRNLEKFSHLFCIIWATWPSGKAGDCKSFFPSSNPGVASSTSKKFRILFFCSADIARLIITCEKQRNVDTLFDSKHKESSMVGGLSRLHDYLLSLIFYH